MLRCNMDLATAPREVFQCGTCTTCRPTSALNYPFPKDLKNSGQLVDSLRELIESGTGLICRNPEQVKWPDLKVVDGASGDLLVCRVEAKLLQGKAFMKALSMVGLQSKETLAVDEPKLLSYFECKERMHTLAGEVYPSTSSGSSTDLAATLEVSPFFRKSMN